MLWVSGRNMHAQVVVQSWALTASNTKRVALQDFDDNSMWFLSPDLDARVLVSNKKNWKHISAWFGRSWIYYIPNVKHIVHTSQIPPIFDVVIKWILMVLKCSNVVSGTHINSRRGSLQPHHCILIMEAMYVARVFILVRGIRWQEIIDYISLHNSRW